MVQARVPKQVLLDGAQMSLTAFLAGTMGFLKAKNIDIKEWVAYIGDRFEDSWGGLEGQGADRVMRHFLTLEVRPLGAEVTSSQLTSEKAEVTLTPLPSALLLEKFGTTPREILRGFGVTQREFASIYGMFEPPAHAIGLHLTHRLRSGSQMLSLEAAPKSRGQRPRRRQGA